MTSREVSLWAGVGQGQVGSGADRRASLAERLCLGTKEEKCKACHALRICCDKSSITGSASHYIC